MKVLVTRAQPANSKTCEALIALGHEPISLPIFELKDTGASIPQDKFHGYIFTSSNAARILLERRNLNLDPSLPVYCVGQKTAQKVAQLGFEKIEIANDNAKTLADLIISKKLGSETSLLYFTTKDRSFDLSNHLAAHDIKVKNLDLYQIAPLKIDQDQFKKAISQITGGTILVYSKRSGEQLAHLLDQSQTNIDALKISAIAISKLAASGVKTLPWERLQISPVANEQSMFHILNK